MSMARKGLKICCGVTLLFIIIIVSVFTALAFTVFKPKQPNITAHPISLGKVQIRVFPNVTLNVTLGMIVTIDNNNYGSFQFMNTTAYVNYHGVIVGEVPIQKDYVAAHARINITTYVDLMADKMIANPNFVDDVIAGSLNLTATAWLHGKVQVLKVLNLHATAFSTCEISIFIKPLDVKSTCKSKIKL